MQGLIRINAIRDRAAELRLTIPTLCARKRVPTSTVYRWLNAETDPRSGAYDAICSKLEAALDEEVVRLRKQLRLRRVAGPRRQARAAS
jgi:hypothetical protein